VNAPANLHSPGLPATGYDLPAVVRLPETPRTAVIGMVLYNHADKLPEAIECFLTQTYADLRLVLVDDESVDETPAVCQHYERLDPRVTYIRNTKRRGMIGNWRYALQAARELYPSAPYYAWASDHDLLHPRWLAECISLLDAHPDTVLVYPQRVALDREDSWKETVRGGFFGWQFETADMKSPLGRMDRALHGMSAGSMVYGLFRAEVLTPAMLNYVYLPDRLFLSQLSLHGEFRQVLQPLYYRREGGEVTLDRQFRGMYPGAAAAPWHLRLPWWLTHDLILFRDLVLKGLGGQRVGRGMGVLATAMYLISTARLFLPRVGAQIKRSVRTKIKMIRTYWRSVRTKMKVVRTYRRNTYNRIRKRLRGSAKQPRKAA